MFNKQSFIGEEEDEGKEEVRKGKKCINHIECS
jgi:hypothetical protein